MPASKKDELEMEKMTYIKVKEKINKGFYRVIIPVGTIEAHGPHLPLATDVYIPIQLAKELAPSIKALIAPPIYYGVTRSLLGYSGSITISTETLKSIIKEIILSLRRHGFRTFLIFNGHGGNIEALRDALYELWLKHGIRSISIDWWIFSKSVVEEVYNQPGAHAGVDETAVILRYYPDLVDTDSYSEEDAFFHRNGFASFPYPGSIITYKDKEGLPNFNKDLAKKYVEKLIKFLQEKIEKILEMIEKI